ncbi:sensor histidine kinase [Massilia sp. YMA4]|uniref:sensor histidine kinase n=1 Tax=Massilia sp. YMA4 TaxID=1593482 RepID=UPI000DD16B7C|nr:histidine kinase [Massilia sp. YMA4]AXA90197.1 histidine kinase [Massilia sp. YMA4]
MYRLVTDLRVRRIPPWTIATAIAALFALLHIAAILAAGPGQTPLHNPIGLATITVVPPLTIGSPEPARIQAVFQTYTLGKLLAVLAMTAAVALACRARARRRTMALALQLACVTVLDALPLHVVLAVQLAMLLPWRAGLAWLAAQYLLGVLVDTALVLDLAGREHTPPQWALLAYLSAERTVLAAAFLIGRLVLREHRLRATLAHAHAQVLATQALLGETVRGAERLRIARDLHDSIGHHLTALNLHLDLATRQAGTGAPALATARAVSADLLAQVRSVVSHTRHDQSIDLAEALRALCAGLPTLPASLHIEPAAARQPAPVAHALYCCMQEAITNALRHACASRLTVELLHDDSRTLARITDDGQGGSALVEGNGLRGMRERLAELGGALHLEARSPGLAVVMTVPHRGSAA